VGFAAHHHA